MTTGQLIIRVRVLCTENLRDARHCAKCFVLRVFISFTLQTSLIILTHHIDKKTEVHRD